MKSGASTQRKTTPSGAHRSKPPERPDAATPEAAELTAARLASESRRAVPVPLELAGYIRRKLAGRRMQQYVQPELHTTTVRAVLAARATDQDPDDVARLIEALIDDLLHLTSEVWIILGMLRDESEEPPA